jgi:hypothetical protein
MGHVKIGYLIFCNFILPFGQIALELFFEKLKSFETQKIRVFSFSSGFGEIGMEQWLTHCWI